VVSLIGVVDSNGLKWLLFLVVEQHRDSFKELESLRGDVAIGVICPQSSFAEEAASRA